MRRARAVPAMLSALVILAAAAGCGEDEQAAPETTRVLVYLLRGEQVGAAARDVPRTAEPARAALEQLLDGPTDAEAEAGLGGTAIPEGTAVRDVAIADGVATVDLSDEFDDGGGSLAMRARLAQVVFTLTQFGSVDAVDFRVDGRPVEVFSSEGIVLDHPQTRADYEEQSPAILVEQPAVGDVVASPLRLTGTANTFEATFEVEVRDPAGAKLAATFVTATCGTGCRGTFDEEVTFDAGDATTVTLVVFERSAKDGSPTKQVEIPLELR